MLRSSDTATYSDFCQDTESHLSRVRSSRSPIYITRRGKPDLVLLSAKQFRAYAEGREYLDAVRAIDEGRRQIAAGKGRPAKEAFEHLARQLEVASAKSATVRGKKKRSHR